MDSSNMPAWRDAVAAISAGLPDQDVTEPRPLKLTVADLERLDASWDADPIHGSELIDGRIYFTPARFRPRVWAATQLSFRIADALKAIGSDAFSGMRGSIAMPPHDLPLPDIVLTDAPDAPGYIPVRSVPLVIEVAETALDFFMGVKARLYAKHGVPECWVVDLQGRVVHQLWDPGPEGYAARREVPLGMRVEAVMISGLGVDTDDI